MAVNDALSSLGGTGTGQTGSNGGISSSDNEQRFLKLLVTQLNNQDPLNPMQNAELTSQLAQMSTVTGIEKLNATLSGLVNQSGTNQVLQAASLVGYNVLSPGNQIGTSAPKDGEEPAVVPFAVQLPGTAGDVQVKIVDSTGRTVRTLELGSMPEGVNAIAWDGKADDGSAVPAGNYSFSVVASNDGVSVAATALTFAQVAAVKQGPNGVMLELANGRSVSLDDVRMYL